MRGYSFHTRLIWLNEITDLFYIILSVGGLHGQMGFDSHEIPGVQRLLSNHIC